ncbi:MAG TPA: hypothetical protein VK604_28770, partial [Bryobacteraceae bacterium]|nr:hypothetical protein [Bryobacteraceae bacterium]
MPLSVLGILVCSCGRSGLPAVDSNQYRELVSAFYVGLAGLQTGEDVRARERLTQATQLAPGEPASWANLALFSVRQQEFDAAYGYAEKARALSPDNSRIEQLLGSIEAKRGKLSESIAHLKKAVQLDGNNLKAIYALAEQTERQSLPSSDADAQELLEKILLKQPGNIAVQVDACRLAAKRGDRTALRRMTGQLAAGSKEWPEEAQQRLAIFQQTANGPNPRAAAVQASFLRNVLARVPAYRRGLERVKTPSIFVGDPFLGFVKLPTPASHPAPPDTALSFSAEELPATANGPVSWVGALPLDASGKFWTATKSGDALVIQDGARLAFPGRGAPAQNSVLAADLNYDFKLDIVLADDAGVRIYQQDNPTRFD